MIEVSHLVKKYGSHYAVNDLTFRVDRGQIYGFLGPNGAGKSTTMNIITGYLAPTSGKVKINGYDIQQEPEEAKRCIGYLPEMPPLYADMTVMEYLVFVSELKRVARKQRKDDIQDVMERTGVTEMKDRPIRNLSKGYKQRVGLAQALVGNPRVLILDEPTVGLDPKQIIEIRTLIRKLGKNHTVILSSHILTEVQAVCDRIVVINKGRIVADDTADNLSSALTADHKLIARIDGPREEVVKVISSIPGVVNVLADMQREKGVWEYNIEAVEGTDIRRELNKRLWSRSWYILGLRSSELTLEDIFLKLTMGESVNEFMTKKAEDLESIDKEGGKA